MPSGETPSPTSKEAKMLILARKRDEKVILSKGGEILCEITITDIQDMKVRLGFEARKDLKIDREEIFIDKYTQKELDRK